MPNKNNPKVNSDVETIYNGYNVYDKHKPYEIKTKVEFVPTSCRICLNDGDIHIYGDESFGGISVAIYKITGVQIKEEDEFPKYLCHSCNEQLQSALILRQIAQETDTLLREAGYINIIETSDTDEDSQKDIFPSLYYQKCSFKDTLEDEHTFYHCSKCDLDFSNSKVYAKHMFTVMHKNVSDTCPFCKRRFKCIVRHLVCHKKNRTHQCDICGKKLMNPAYSVHRETHFDNLPFKCSECPYKGKFKGDFKIHMRTHTGEKPYKCTQCLRRFTSKSNLNRHGFTHKTELIYECEVCQRGFCTQHKLDKHMRVHTGGKVHCCRKCDKSFVHRNTLMKHTLLVHKRGKLRTGRIPNYLKINDDREEDLDKEYLIIDYIKNN